MYVNDTCLADSDDDDDEDVWGHDHHHGSGDLPCAQYPITIGGLMESYADLTPGGMWWGRRGVCLCCWVVVACSVCGVASGGVALSV